MIDQIFCEKLEYKICAIFSNTNHIVAKKFCCDGILLPLSDLEISKKHINDTKQIDNFTAYIGNDGQDKYSLTLRFGSKSQSRFARNLDIIELIADDTKFEIDIETKSLTLYLP